MKSGSGWRFVDGAPKPVEKPAQPSLQVQLPRQPVLELSDTAGMVAVARSFFVGKPPVPITIATGSQPRAHATKAAGECAQGPTTEEASTNSRESQFFRMSFTVTDKIPDRYTAEWTKGVAESLATYVFKNCEEGIVVRSNHDTSLQLEAAFKFGSHRIGANIRKHLKTETIPNSFRGKGFTTDNFEVKARILSSHADRRHAFYEDLRAMTQDASRQTRRAALMDLTLGAMLRNRCRERRRNLSCG